MALGGAGGELLGGLWVLLLSFVTLRTRPFPRMVSLLGLVIGVLGLTSVVPPLPDAGIGFGVLQIVWFLCVAWILTRTPQGGAPPFGAWYPRPDSNRRYRIHGGHGEKSVERREHGDYASS
jgi:hypothetical protein